MGKLIETLQRVGKPSGGGIGFLGRAQAQTKPKAAGLVVALSQPDTGAVEAVARAGADGVLFIVQNGGSVASSVEPYYEAAAALRATNLPWGLDLADVAEALEPKVFKTLREGGVDFVTFPLNAPARLLQERPEGLDRIVTLGEQRDDPYLLLARAVNLLSVQAVLFEFGWSVDRLRHLTIEELLRYRMLRETLRFPVLVSVKGKPGSDEVRTLMKLGISGVVVQPARDERMAALAQRVAALREELERVPGPEADEEVPSIGQFQMPSAPKPGEQPGHEH